ncbi:chorion peroxidase [Trichonephila clavipes]|nr:chorion peroxidase [Trichonephila clavipes]
MVGKTGRKEERKRERETEGKRARKRQGLVVLGSGEENPRVLFGDADQESESRMSKNALRTGRRQVVEIYFYILVSIWLKVSFSLEDKDYLARLKYDKIAVIAREKRAATEFSSSSSDYYDISEDADNTYEASNDSEDTPPEDPNQCKDYSPLQCDPAHPYRTFDGTCNNLDHPTWGSANECYLRFQKAFYDGYGGVRKSVTGDPLPEPRNLTVNIFRDAKHRSRRTSFLLTIFGQAVAHDLGNIVILDDKAECCSPGNENNPGCLPIRLSPDDPDFSRYNVTCRNFQTSKDCHLCDTANKEPMSDVTSFLDASIAYGNSDEKANSIRRNDGTGKLISNETDVGELLPNGKDPHDPFCPKVQESLCFYAGNRDYTGMWVRLGSTDLMAGKFMFLRSNQGGRLDGNESVADSFRSDLVGFKSWSARILGAFYSFFVCQKNPPLPGSSPATRGQSHPSLSPSFKAK